MTQRLHRRQNHMVKHPPHAIVQRTERLQPHSHLRLGLGQQLEIVHQYPRTLPLLLAAAVKKHDEVHEELESVSKREVSVVVECGLHVSSAGGEVDGVELTGGSEPKLPLLEILRRSRIQITRQLPIHQLEKRAKPPREHQQLRRVGRLASAHGMVGRIHQECRDSFFGKVRIQGGERPGAVGLDCAGEGRELMGFEEEPLDLLLDEFSLVR
mmetsp:Transcript_30334/g.63389  ORF Transcript_30334/g.63389 Transcript_30334/m.63389 type:complete len:212 (-) Transcript_30334:1004-1639(-)